SEHGTGDLLEDTAVVEGGEGSVEEDGRGGGGLFEQKAVGKDLGCAATEREHEVAAAECGGEGARLEAAEVGFPVAREDLRDTEAGAGFEVRVEVDEGPAETIGEQATDGGLAGAH